MWSMFLSHQAWTYAKKSECGDELVDFYTWSNEKQMRAKKWF